MIPALLAIGILLALAFFTASSYLLALMSSSSSIGATLGVLGIVALSFAAFFSFRGLINIGLSYRKLNTLLAILLTVFMGACTRVEPGWEGIKVDMLGGDRGQSYPIVTGRVYFNPYSEDVYQFPTFLQRVQWTASNGSDLTFRSKEGYAFNVDVGVGISFLKGKTPEVFVAYRRDASDIINGPFRDIISEAYVKVGSQMEGLNILGEGMNALNTGVTEVVRTSLGHIAKVDYINVIGKPRVESQVEQSINAVIKAVQEAKEAEATVRTREAQAKQAVATAAGTAEARRIDAISKAEAIRIEAEALRTNASVIEMRAIEKWNGVMPLVSGGGATPFINVPTNR